MRPLRQIGGTSDGVQRPGGKFFAFLLGLHNRTVLFRIGDWIFVTYGLFAAVAFFLGFTNALWYDAMSGQHVAVKASFYLFGLLPAVLLGSRLFSVLLEWPAIFGQPLTTLLKPGYMFHGGVFGGLAALWAYSIARDVSLAQALDAVAFGLPLGQAACRLGCYVYGCCWGKPTECRLGVPYVSDQAKVVRCAPELRGVRIHPVQLYNSFAHLALFAVFWSLLPFKAFDGMFFVIYCLVQPVVRVVLETFRQDDRGRLFSHYTHTQLYSAILFALGLAGLVYYSHAGVNTTLDMRSSLTSVVTNPSAVIYLGAISAIVGLAFGVHYRSVGSWMAPIQSSVGHRSADTVIDRNRVASVKEIASNGPESSTTDMLIVGAGPYGVSLSYDLYCQGVDFQIVGQPFSLWRRHVLSSASLRSDINASQVFARDNRFSLRTFLRSMYPPHEADRIARQRIPVKVFQAYTDWILDRLPFRPIDQKVVNISKRCEADGEGFQAELADGKQIVANKVVLASGIESHRVMHESLQRLSPQLVFHSWQIEKIENLRGQRLLIAGGGQSAAELISHLADSNQITWVHRSKLIFFAEPINLPRPIFALVLRASLIYYFLPDRLRKLLGRLFVAATIMPDLKARILRSDIPRIQSDVGALELIERDGRVYSRRLDQSFDRVIACTGYRYSLQSLGFLAPDLLESIQLNRMGTPSLGFHFETSVSNLYMIGGIAEPVHGPALRFMIGCRQATLRVSRALCK